MSVRTFRLVAVIAFLLFLLPFLHLVVHTSHDAVILGRYSTGFFRLLVTYAGALTAALVIVIFALRTSHSSAFQLTALAVWIRRRRWALIPLLFVPLLVMILCIDRVQKYAWGQSAVFQLSFPALVLLLDGVLLLAGQTGRERKETLARVTLLMLGILFALGPIELASYLWERSTAQGPLGWTLVASRRIRLERHGSLDRPYYLFRPNENYLWEGIPVHINSRGFRTEEFVVPKPADTYRILNVGDSVAFGWEVRQEDTYGKQLERMLNARSDGRRYQVINAAIPGWSIEAERNFLLQKGLDYQPDMVLLDFTVANDIFGRGLGASESSTVFEYVLGWLRDYTYSWPFLATQASFLLAKLRDEPIHVLNPPGPAEAYYPLDEDNPVWDEIWAWIAEMGQICQQSGIRFVVVAFPAPFQLYGAAHPNVPQRVLARRAAAAGIEFVDLLPIYHQVCDDAAPGTCESYENLLFADVWMHPNPLGHRLAAEALSTKLNGSPRTYSPWPKASRSPTVRACEPWEQSRQMHRKPLLQECQ